MSKILRYSQFEAESYVFDFDDTLAVTDDLVGIMRMVNNNPIIDIVRVLTKMGVNSSDIVKVTKSKKYYGNIAWVTSKGYRDYIQRVKSSDKLENIVGSQQSGNITIIYEPEHETGPRPAEYSEAPTGRSADDPAENRSNIRPNIVKDLIDFTSSASLNKETTKPVKAVVDVMRTASDHGQDVDVVTARRGERKMTSIDGEEVTPTNREDIANWLKHHGVDIDPSDIHSASDNVKSDFAKEKANIVDKNIIHKKKPERVHFFDDDRKNAEAVADLDEPDTDVYVYTGEFAKGAPVSKPTYVKKKNKNESMNNIIKFDDFIFESDKPTDEATWRQMFDKFADVLEGKKCPCKLVLNKFGNQFELQVHCGFDYPDSLFDKIYAAAESAGIGHSWYAVCAESSGGDNLETKRIAGGPKRYTRGR